MSTNTPEKKPWYRKVWVWAIVVAVILIGGISNLLNGDDKDPVADATPSATASVENAAETSSPTPTEAGVSDVERAATIEAALQDAFGGQAPAEVYASDPSLWYGYVNGVRVENGNAFITLQVAADDPDRKSLGERAAQALSTLLPKASVEGIRFLIVEDASGVVIDQKQPRPIV